MTNYPNSASAYSRYAQQQKKEEQDTTNIDTHFHCGRTIQNIYFPYFEIILIPFQSAVRLLSRMFCSSEVAVIWS